MRAFLDVRGAQPKPKRRGEGERGETAEGRSTRQRIPDSGTGVHTLRVEGGMLRYWKKAAIAPWGTDGRTDGWEVGIKTEGGGLLKNTLYSHC